MTAAELAVILEHLPPELPVHIAGRGECMEVRRYHHLSNPWVAPGVYLDAGETFRLLGLFRERRTLDVRLAVMAERSA